MVPMTSILVATDFSDGARYAAERAAFVAQEQSAHLSLIHVMSRSALSDLRKLFFAPPDVETTLIDDAKHTLNAIADGLSRQTGVIRSTDVKTGHAQAEILSATESADLLVLGAHGESSLPDLMLGTTAERVLSACTRPVLVVKSPRRRGISTCLCRSTFRPILLPPWPWQAGSLLSPT